MPTSTSITNNGALPALPYVLYFLFYVLHLLFFFLHFWSIVLTMMYFFITAIQLWMGVHFPLNGLFTFGFFSKIFVLKLFLECFHSPLLCPHKSFNVTGAIFSCPFLVGTSFSNFLSTCTIFRDSTIFY